MNEKDLGPITYLKESLSFGDCTPRRLNLKEYTYHFNEDEDYKDYHKNSKSSKKEEVYELISALKELNYDDEISLEVISNLEKTLKEIL